MLQPLHHSRLSTLPSQKYACACQASPHAFTRRPKTFSPHAPAATRHLLIPASAASASFPSVNGSASSSVPASAASPKAFDPWAWWKIEPPKEAEHSIASQDSSTGPAELGQLVDKLVKLSAPDGALICFALFHMLVAAAAELAIPHFATTSIFAAGNAAAAGTSMETVWPHIKTLGALVLVYGSFASMRGMCFSVLNNRMILRLRMSLFQNLTQRETAFFDGVSVGVLTSRLQSDCQAIAKCFSINFNISLRNLFQAIGGFIYLWFLSKEMCLVTLGISTILWALTLAYGNYTRHAQRVNQDVMACANQVADEVMSLSRLVRAFGTEGQELQRYCKWLGRFYSIGVRQAGAYASFVVFGHIACYACKVVALLLGCAMVLRGELNSEQLTNYIFYTEFVVYSSLNVCDEFTEVMEAMGASERVLKLLDGKPAPQIGSTHKKVLDWSGQLCIKDVTFRYPGRPSHTALDKVTLDLPPGSLTALVGQSGSGKSSVVMLLKRLYDPNEGALLLDGVDLRDVDPLWYRSQIGVVSQEPSLFSGTVAENIAYGCYPESYCGVDHNQDHNRDQDQDQDGDQSERSAMSSSSPPSPSTPAVPTSNDTPFSSITSSSSTPTSTSSLSSTPTSSSPTPTFPTPTSSPSSSTPISTSSSSSTPTSSSSNSNSNFSPTQEGDLASSNPTSCSTGSTTSITGSKDAASDIDAKQFAEASKSWPTFEGLLDAPNFPLNPLDSLIGPSQADIEDAARQANAHDFIMALPQGYQTMVTDKLLSGGQKQRISLARALIRNPRLLVLDEATSALDAESEAQVQAALDKAMLLTDRSVVVIAHRLTTVRKADKIVVMDNGAVSEVGDHEALMEKRGIYWNLVMRQDYGLTPEDAALLATPA